MKRPTESQRALARNAGQELDALLRTCRRLLSARGEANSAGLAATALVLYRALSESARVEFFRHLATELGPDPARVLQAAQRFADTPDAAHLAELTAAAEPPRQELLRRLNRTAGGTAVIVQMRRHLLKLLEASPPLAAVEAD